MIGFFVSREARQNANELYELTKKEGLQPGDPRWDGTPATHCNEYLYEAAVLLGFNVEQLLNPKGIGWTNANDMYKNMRKAVIEKRLYTLNGKQSQKAANEGRFIAVLAYNILGGAGHVAVVYPTPGMYYESQGPRIVQAGAKNGMFWLNEIFNVSELTTVVFCELPKAAT